MRRQCTGVWITRAALALSLTSFWGCSSDSIESCIFSHSFAGTITVTSIDPSPAEPRQDHGVPCSVYHYTWTTGGPSANPEYDHFYATDACAAEANAKVGASFEARREEGPLPGFERCGPTTREYYPPGIQGCQSHCL